jgi:hypothetical protein
VCLWRRELHHALGTAQHYRKVFYYHLICNRIARRFGMQSLWMRFGHPIGKRNDGLSGIHPADRSALTLEALVQRTRIDPALVDDVIPGAT